MQNDFTFGGKFVNFNELSYTVADALFENGISNNLRLVENLVLRFKLRL